MSVYHLGLLLFRFYIDACWYTRTIYCFTLPKQSGPIWKWGWRFLPIPRSPNFPLGIFRLKTSGGGGLIFGTTVLPPPPLPGGPLGGTGGAEGGLPGDWPDPASPPPDCFRTRRGPLFSEYISEISEALRWLGLLSSTPNIVFLHLTTIALGASSYTGFSQGFRILGDENKSQRD